MRCILPPGYIPGFMNALLFRLDLVLVGLDHLLDHLSADASSLTGGKVAVVALIEGYANFTGGFHLELIKGFLCLRNKCSITFCHFGTPLRDTYDCCLFRSDKFTEPL